jgi:uncharacterized membrane protein
MSEAVRVGSPARVEARPRLRVSLSTLTIGSLAIAAGAYYAVCGLLIHYSFHSYGWDLGIFDQVLWSIGHGHGFHYSFRDMQYLGDHFQPMLVFLAPLIWLRLGPGPILVVQGLAFGAAVIPLYAAARRLGGSAAAWGLCAAYLLSLAVARADSYDFHPECFVPVLAFTALWGLATGRPAVFAAATLALLPLKEDMVFLVLGLCWVSWLGFGERRPAQWIALGSVAYLAVISLAVMPLFNHGNSNPLIERYPYLGHTPGSIFLHAIIRPDLIADHLAHVQTARTLLYLLAGAGFMPLFRPKLLPPLVLLLLPPMLAVNTQQQLLELHYGVVPYTYAFIVAAMVLESGYLGRLLERARIALPSVRIALPGVAVVLAVALFAWKSPLPPSFAANMDEFTIDHHSDVARSFVDMVPGDAIVSAQAGFVPHLSERYDIFEFPRISKATYLLVDDNRGVPGYDWPAYNSCRALIPSFGFHLVREEDGIQLWQRSAADAATYGSAGCG